MTIATGVKVTLRRAAPGDRARIHEWIIGSDLSAHTMGGPLYPDHPVPSLEEFSAAWGTAAFDGSQPYAGRMFVIAVDGIDVGALAHGPIDLLNDVVELNIWLTERRLTGRGYGSEALILLADWLQANYGVNRFLVRPSRRNVKALRALRRAGFRETDLPPGEVSSKLALRPGEYDDEILLFRILPVPTRPLEPRPGRVYVFIDSEFTSLQAPQLISVGAVATDATAFYAEIDTWPRDRASEFVKDVVVPLLDGDAVPREVGAEALTAWLAERAQDRQATIVSDSGFDRWALTELFGHEDLPPGIEWLRVPVAYEKLDEIARDLKLRRHHALDDARALRHAVLGPA